MTHRIRILVIALLMAAVAAPRGVVMAWCNCSGPEAQCCRSAEGPSCCSVSHGCCGGVQDEGDLGEGERLVPDEHCGCIVSIELDEVEGPLPGTASDASEFAPPAQIHRESRAFVHAPSVVRCSLRAPPQVIPAGLRPGTAPLRI